MQRLPMEAMPSVTGTTSRRSSATLGWNGFGAALVAVPAGVHRIAAESHHRVGVHVGAPIRARCFCGTRRIARIQAHGDADVVPAGLDGEWVDEADCTILRLWLSPALVSDTLERMGVPPSRAQLVPRLQLRDARVTHLAWALRAELEDDRASNALFAESLATALVVRLATAEPPAQKRRRTLMPRAAARLADYIESRLAEPLTLAEMAALVDLSVPHFKVLFRETFGMPAHRYVVERRVERARALLAAGGSSVAQVALDAGFAHQSHLAHWTRRLLGVAPNEIARATGAALGATAEHGR